MKKLAIALGAFMGTIFAAIPFKERGSHWVQWSLGKGILIIYPIPVESPLPAK